MTPHVPDPRTLRRLAGEATPGPWGAPNPIWPEKAMPVYGHATGMDQVALTTAREFDQRQRDAAYIAAASPDVVLGLLDRLAALERFLADSHGRVIEDLKAPPALQESPDDRL